MGTVRLMTRVSRGAAPVAGPTLNVTREQIIAFRRRIGALDERLPPGSASLGRAVWAGLQDSVPRSALHSLHARVGAASRPYGVTLIPGRRVPSESRGMEVYTHTRRGVGAR